VIIVGVPIAIRVLAVASASALPLWLSAGCSTREPGHRECTEQEEGEADSLSKLPILGVFPARTQAAGAFSGCGKDDSGDPIAPNAGRRYRSALDEPQIRSFYWAELGRDGWRNASAVIPPDVAPSLAFQRGISCLVKDFRGVQIRFDIRFDPTPSASPPPSGEARLQAYTIQVVVRTDRQDDC
jgi:hypothetical protein